MIRLAIDTSTMTQSIAVERDGELLEARTTRLRIGHSETLLPSIEATLQQLELTIDDVDEIVCGLGPGSFTGVRIEIGRAACREEGVIKVADVTTDAKDRYQAQKRE